MLARANHDYQGHRARAMQHVSMAIRSLSHQSMGYRGMGMGMGNGMNLAGAMGMRRVGGGGAGFGARRTMVMSQAQSDAIMSQALRTLQGIGMQLGSTGTYSGGHAQASMHVQRATQEVGIALSVR